MLLAIFCSLLFFTSCDVKPKLSSISNISATFDPGALSFPGGIIVVGDRTDAPGKVSYSFASGVTTPVSMERGDWTFYSIGYSGATPFTGIKHCSLSKVSVRGGKSTTINIELTTEGCSGKLVRDLKFKNITVKSCSAFYDGITGAYNPVNLADPATWCRNSPEQLNRTNYFKVSALNIQGTSNSQGISSSCLPIGYFGELPTNVVPLQVKFYQTIVECQSSPIAHASLDMVNGLETGDVTNFDHYFADLSAVDTRLVLPDTHTKRFKSPFMNMIPKILCGVNTDCHKHPVLPQHAYIPWYGEVKKQLLLTNVIEPDCSNLTHNSKYFSFKNCEVKNGSAYADIKRNTFSCQPTGGYLNVTYKDFYSRNDRIFMLTHDLVKSYVSVTSKDGSPENVFEAAADLSIKSIAVDSNEIVYALSTNLIKYFKKNANGDYYLFKQLVITKGDHLEVDPAGKFLIIGDADSYINVLDSNTGALISNTLYSGAFHQLQLVGGDLYSHEYVEDAPYNPPTVPVIDIGFIRRTHFDLSTGELTRYPYYYVPGGFGGDGMVSNGYFQWNFHIGDNGDMYVVTHSSFDPGTWPDGIIVMTKNPADIWYTYQGLGGSPNVENVLHIGQYTYTINGGELKSFNTTGLFSDAGSYSGECQETFSLSIGSVTKAGGLNFLTTLTPGNVQTNPDLYKTAMKLSGVTDITDTNMIYHYFPHMNEEQTKATSGGKLNRSQRLLGPNGLGGMFYDYLSCTDLKLAAGIAPVYRTFAVDDPYSGFRTYQVTITGTSEVIPPFNCSDAAPNAACSTAYDLMANVRSVGLYEKEHYKLKLKCEEMIGDLDYLKYDSGETKKERYFWNTNSMLGARVDSYQSLKSGTDFTAEVATAVKYSLNDLWGRIITYDKSSDKIRGDAIEYLRTSSEHAFSLETAEDEPALFPLNATYSTIKGNTSPGPITSCLPVGSSLVTTASNPGCLLDNVNSFTNSMGLTYSLQSIEDSESESSAFQSIFNISP